MSAFFLSKIKVLKGAGARGQYVPLNGGQAKQAHAVVDDDAGGVVQGHTGLLELGLAADDLEVVVAARDGVGEAEEVGEDGGGLPGLVRVGEDVGPLDQVAAEVDGLGLLEQGEVGRGDLLVREAGLALDGVEAGVGVLQVRAGVALEGGHGVHVEPVVVDPVAHQLVPFMPRTCSHFRGGFEGGCSHILPFIS